MSNHPSGFTGWTHVGSDARIEITHGQGGVEDVQVEFPTTASRFVLPALFLSQDKGRELRDALIAVYHDIDTAEAQSASMTFGGDFIHDAYVRGEN